MMKYKEFKKVTFNKFSALVVKQRMELLQNALNEIGYDISISLKYDKPTKKAIIDIQKQAQITPNGVICEKTYEVVKNKLMEK